MTALTQVCSCLGDLNVLEIIIAPSKVVTESNVFSQSHGDFANYCVHLFLPDDDNNDVASDGGDAQHGGGLRHTEDGDAHQSHLW